MNIENPADLLRAYGAGTKKRFGQHFLSDPGILDRVADVADVQVGDRVLEIGPGAGPLTWTMLERGADVHAVEVDRHAAAFLRETFAQREGFALTEQDALRVDWAAFLGGEDEPQWKCVSNLPYNVGTEVFFKLSAQSARFASMSLMFQREVAQRMVATHEDGPYGVLSLMTRLYHDATLSFVLPPGAFRPPPRVHSAVIGLVPVPGTRIPDEVVRAKFIRVVKAAFSVRRKKIINGLKTLGVGKTEIRTWLEEAEISSDLRPEQVSFEAFERLARHANL